MAADYKLLDHRASWAGFAKGSTEFKEMEAEVHLRAAQRLLWLSSSLGGMWTKLCQYMSTLNGILPEPYTAQLSSTQDRAKRGAAADIAAVIRDELGASIEELFREFDLEPLASASIAQVHRAVTHDGQEVAVKVQHRSLRGILTADLLAIKVGPDLPLSSWTIR